MSDIDEKALFDGPSAAQPDRSAFEEAELVVCDACLRMNPPTRGACLYCGAKLQASKHTASPDLESAAPAVEGGYHLVLISAAISDLSGPALDEGARLVHLSTPEFKAIVESRQRLPLVRTATTEQAKLTTEKLKELGIVTTTVADETLSAETPPKRVRAMEFTEDELIALPTGVTPRMATSWSDVVLLVVGRLVVHRHEVEERRKRGRMQPVDSRDLSTDETVLDIYSQGYQNGWRVQAGNFDFSCLGPVKTVTAFANFAALIDALRASAGSAQFDDSYVSSRPLLSSVWPIEPQTRKGEWKRSGAVPVFST